MPPYDDDCGLAVVSAILPPMWKKTAISALTLSIDCRKCGVDTSIALEFSNSAEVIVTHGHSLSFI